MKKYGAFIVSAVATVALCVFIFCMSAEVGDDSSALSSGFTASLLRLVVPNFDALSLAEQQALLESLSLPVRKLAHFTEFAALGASFFALAWNAENSCAQRFANATLKPRRVLALAWALATAYAVSDEFHQIFVPGRACMVGDMLIDSSGVLFGALLALLIATRKRQTPKR